VATPELLRQGTAWTLLPEDIKGGRREAQEHLLPGWRWKDKSRVEGIKGAVERSCKRFRDWLDSVCCAVDVCRPRRLRSGECAFRYTLIAKIPTLIISQPARLAFANHIFTLFRTIEFDFFIFVHSCCSFMPVPIPYRVVIVWIEPLSDGKPARRFAYDYGVDSPALVHRVRGIVFYKVTHRTSFVNGVYDVSGIWHTDTFTKLEQRTAEQQNNESR
jgi:hypothetical protein